MYIKPSKTSVISLRKNIFSNTAKKLLGISLLSASINVFATENMNNMSDMSSMNHSNMMYLDFGLGVGGASGWGQSSLAINAMTMGFYLNKNLGIEVGMDALPDGANSAGQSMIMSYHMAAKGMLPLSNVFSLYGKAGVGVNSFSGEQLGTNGMGMANEVSLGLYYAGGMQFNFNKNFALYLEGSGIAGSAIGNNHSSNVGNFGSSYMGTLGLEVRI